MGNLGITLFLLSFVVILPIAVYYVIKGGKKGRKEVITKWQKLLQENNELGFTKKIIAFDFLPSHLQDAELRNLGSRQADANRIDVKLQRKILSMGANVPDRDVFDSSDFFNGIWINYQKKIIKCREYNNYFEIPFQNLYDVGMDKIGSYRTIGGGLGDAISLFGANTTETLKRITIQIVINDPRGGLETKELVLCNNFFSLRRGTTNANAYEKCAAAILNEVSYIINNKEL